MASAMSQYTSTPRNEQRSAKAAPSYLLALQPAAVRIIAQPPLDHRYHRSDDDDDDDSASLIYAPSPRTRALGSPSPPPSLPLSETPLSRRVPRSTAREDPFVATSTVSFRHNFFGVYASLLRIHKKTSGARRGVEG